MEREEEAWSTTLGRGYAEGRGSRWKDGKRKGDFVHRTGQRILERVLEMDWCWHGMMEQEEVDIIHSTEERLLKRARGWQRRKEGSIRNIVERVLSVGMRLA